MKIETWLLLDKISELLMVVGLIGLIVKVLAMVFD